MIRKLRLPLSSLSFALLSYWFYWLLFNGEIVISNYLLFGFAGLTISLFATLSFGDIAPRLENYALSGIFSCTTTFLVWLSINGRHPFMRELPSLFLLSFSVILAFRALRTSDDQSISISIVASEVALAFAFGWWAGREFEGHSRPILTIVLISAIIVRSSLLRLSLRFEEITFDQGNRWSWALFSIALGLIAFKYDIEGRVPWSSDAKYDLHLASQNLLPVVIAWLLSASFALWYLSTSEKQTS